MPSPIRVAVVNWSSHISDADLTSGVAALQAQVHNEFSNAWHVDADLYPCATNAAQDGSVWGLILLDQASIAYAGYGDATSGGLPLAKVDVSALAPGEQWTHRASHALLEMLVDPVISSTVYRQVANPDRYSLYAHEICDPCDGTEHGYVSGGWQLADFVLPAWFGQPGGSGFDQQNHVTAPFQVLANSYAYVFDLPTGTLSAIDAMGNRLASQPALDVRLGRLQSALSASPTPPKTPPPPAGPGGPGGPMGPLYPP